MRTLVAVSICAGAFCPDKLVSNTICSTNYRIHTPHHLQSLPVSKQYAVIEKHIRKMQSVSTQNFYFEVFSDFLQYFVSCTKYFITITLKLDAEVL